MTETTLPPMGPPPSKHKPDKVKVYKNIAGRGLTAHVFFSKGINISERIPGYLFFHPGGWAMGEPEWGYDLCYHISKLGVVAISFEYRLSSIGGDSPADAVSDAKSAIRWTREHSGELGIDPGMILAGGISAGGHLALCTAMIPGFDDPGDNMDSSAMPQALALHTAPVNPAMDNHFITLLQGKTKPEDLSPFHHVKGGLPPMCMIQGTADEIVPYDSIEVFSRRMQEAGNQCALYSFEGAGHFSIHETDQARAIRLIDEFILSVIK
ncbi:MAG: alpha/beta hydrolase [Deltaproteobacteria bacterium]|nr:alpha/beta hydrolase [Deltaproteobacteria bacterium]